ncbi:MAG: cyclic nucleotide-binding domain-containing protein [Chloroflexi bacterium]|nr:cyclic nucleotide-binding domain-containing protein [Chloroflexota bacterium]
MIPIPGRVAYLHRIHLFHDLNEEELTPIAEKLDEVFFEEGKEIFKEGSAADRFYIIYQGKVKITQMRRKGIVELASLVNGDYFGEEALFIGRRRSATITAVEKTSMFSLTRPEFNELIKRFPKLKVAFETSIASRRLARQLRFKWLRSDEVVYFLARKHYTLLIDALALPIFLALAAMAVTAWGILVTSWITSGAGVIFFVLMVLWAIWRGVDWGNDYYIVTNQRVIWLEKVVGIYDSRQEAPLSTVLSVGVETDLVGRMLDYGNVVVRTFVGKIPFNHVAHPYQASHMVEEQWSRSKHVASAQEKEAMRDAIRKKLGLTEKIAVKPASQTEKASVPRLYKPGWGTILLAKLFQNSKIFRVRFQSGDTITYRKHIFVLIKHIWLPALVCLFFVLGMGLRAYAWIRAGMANVDILFLLLFITFVYPLWRLIYQYLDWSNDIFQVTDDQIIDIDKKPFGTEERKAAPLENILATASERLGILGHIFNYGTVYITVGGSKLAFEDVYNPAAVQQDIDDRRIARKSKQEEGRAAAERERMADWLASYHENIQDIEGELRQPENGTKSD